MNSAAAHRIPALDGVRGLAVTLLVLSHLMISTAWAGTRTWSVLHGGWLGVDLFFVLSGFLITGILLDTKGRENYFASFFLRRVLRIFPLYYACLLAVWLVVVFVEHASQRLTGYDSLGWYVAYGSNIAMALKGEWTYQSDYLTLSHFWSLAVEEQFYLVWPLVVWLLPRRPLMALCAAMLFFGPDLRDWADGTFHKAGSLASYSLTVCRMDSLAAGAFLATLRRSPIELPWPRKQWITPVALGLWSSYMAFAYWRGELHTKWHAMMVLALLFVLLPHRDWVARVMAVFGGLLSIEILMMGGSQEKWTFPILFFAALVHLATREGRFALVRTFCESRFLTHMGQYSYALYVFHHLFKPLYMRAFGQRLMQSELNPVLSQSLYIVVAFGLTYAVSRLSWVLLEKRFLDLKERWSPAKQAASNEMCYRERARPQS